MLNKNTPLRPFCLVRIEVPTPRRDLEDAEERGGLGIRDSSGINLDCHVFLKAKFGGQPKDS